MSNQDPRPIVPVILSGGSGTRLWPLSRKGYPKQFLPLVNHDTMFAATVERALGVPGAMPPLVLASEGHRFLVAEQVQALAGASASILLEPCARNTAPAIGAAAHYIMTHYGEAAPLMLVLPADHAVEDNAAFVSAVLAGTAAARAGHLVTFGILPTRPETGYGYIRADAASPVDASRRVLQVAEFVEKPDRRTAEGYLASGDYTWNSGIFLFRPDIFLDELRRHAPVVADRAVAAVDAAHLDLDFIRLDAEAFSAAPATSVDFAVMERTTRAAVIALDCGWSDVGSWSALWDLGVKDATGNVIDGDIMTMDTRDSYLLSQHRLVATVGVDDLVVIETPDSVLVAHKDKVQDVKDVVERLLADARPEADLHREVHRPWGTFDCIDRGERFQVKRITVSPGARLSSQKHVHRAEHWIVVKGTAEVTRDGQTLYLTENESTFIPLGSVHRLANPGKVPLEIIEVQSGKYLGEDDIVRFDDAYGRESDKPAS